MGSGASKKKAEEKKDEAVPAAPKAEEPKAEAAPKAAEPKEEPKEAEEPPKEPKAETEPKAEAAATTNDNGNGESAPAESAPQATEEPAAPKTIDWAKLDEKLPHAKDPESKKLRLEMFDKMDVNKSRQLSLMEVSAGMEAILADFTDVKVATVIRSAFNVAKAKSLHGTSEVVLTPVQAHMM